jgi:branched-chain amino acid transport system permease protein
MDTLILALASGSLYGLSLLLITIGLTLIFGVGRVVNFAHGAIYALGAFLGATLSAVIGFGPAIVVAPLFVGAAAVVLERLLIRRLRSINEITTLLFTFGLGVTLDAAITMIWGARSYTVAMPKLLTASISLSEGQIPLYSVFLGFVSLLITGVLLAVLNLTSFGLHLRAASEDPATAEIAGIDVNNMFTCVFGIGSAFAALAGVLVLPIVGASSGMDLQITVLVFIIVIVGGLGSLSGTVLASLLVGVVVTLGATYISSLAYLLLFGAVIATLVVRPNGLVTSRQE